MICVADAAQRVTMLKVSVESLFGGKTVGRMGNE
jgi:hypothetical protein